MSGATLHVETAGPGLSVQDLGRPGHIARGLSRGGAADRIALLEAAALLGAGDVGPAIEMAGMGGRFTVDAPMRFALTGAPMQVEIDGRPLDWNAVHVLLPGACLHIGGVRAGVYGYLTPAGGLGDPGWLGSQAAHLSIALGSAIAAGDRLALGVDAMPELPPLRLPPDARFAGGDVRVMPGPQTGLFDAGALARFFDTPFARAPEANRQGVRLEQDGDPFFPADAAGLASDFIVPGDVQMTGTGVPYVLLSECQTIGGYPRIGTVLPDDLPRVAQAPLGASIRFVSLTEAGASAAAVPEARRLDALRKAVTPLLRDPAQITDLLSFQLVGGVTAGDDLDR